VPLANLLDYAGNAGVLVDTNVWVDCTDESSQWHEWAVESLQQAGERYRLHINVIIYAELLIPAPDIKRLDALLDVYDTVRSALPWAAAPLAAAAHSIYRKSGGTKNKPLPDFFIGAHAAVSNLSVLTRDPRPYKNYFARLKVLSP
jgi:predicted nucleic acid-binding protein